MGNGEINQSVVLELSLFFLLASVTTFSALRVSTLGAVCVSDSVSYSDASSDQWDGRRLPLGERSNSKV